MAVCVVYLGRAKERLRLWGLGCTGGTGSEKRRLGWDGRIAGAVSRRT